MADTSARAGASAAQMLADALLRTLTGGTASFRLTPVNCESSQSELSLLTTSYVDVAIGPVVMRKLKPEWQPGSSARWEMLVSASAVQQQVNSLELESAKSLFNLTLAVSIAGQSYLIESFTSNEALGQIYLYRLLLREVKQANL